MCSVFTVSWSTDSSCCSKKKSVNISDHQSDFIMILLKASHHLCVVYVQQGIFTVSSFKRHSFLILIFLILIQSNTHYWVLKLREAQFKLSSADQFSSRWYLCAREGPYALHTISQEFPQCCPCLQSSLETLGTVGLNNAIRITSFTRPLCEKRKSVCVADTWFVVLQRILSLFWLISVLNF